VLPFLEADNFDALAMLSELLHPTAEETQDGILSVDGLRDY